MRTSIRVMSGVLLILATTLTVHAQDDKKTDRKSEKTVDKKSAKKGADEATGFGETLEHGIKFGSQEVQRWKVGIIVTAPQGGPCGGVYGTVPVPTDWPEQQVRKVAEDLSPQAKVDYRSLDNGVKQMLVSIPLINAGESAHALVTFEITKCVILPPDDPSEFQIPEKLARKFSPFLGASPFIESTNIKIKNLAKEITKDKEQPWQQVEAIYDYVRDKVEYRDGPLKGALAALKDGTGDCEELTSLFIALCRASRIPARTVWVHGHCYPEFYLEDKSGTGHWIPCQAAGTRDFGGMPDARPILQKGDNYRVPEKKEPQRYVAEYLSVKSVQGKPTVKFVREAIPAG